MSESSKFNINIGSTVVTQIGDHAKIVVNQHDIDVHKLKSLVLVVREEIESSNMNDEDKSALYNNLEALEREAQTEAPRKGFVKTALAVLQAAKGTCEFGAAVATLVQFVQSMLKL